jgi:hypothetical protein
VWISERTSRYEVLEELIIPRWSLHVTIYPDNPHIVFESDYIYGSDTFN